MLIVDPHPPQGISIIFSPLCMFTLQQSIANNIMIQILRIYLFKGLSTQQSHLYQYDINTGIFIAECMNSTKMTLSLMSD